MVELNEYIKNRNKKKSHKFKCEERIYRICLKINPLNIKKKERKNIIYKKCAKDINKDKIYSVVKLRKIFKKIEPNKKIKNLLRTYYKINKRKYKKNEKEEKISNYDIFYNKKEKEKKVIKIKYYEKLIYKYNPASLDNLSEYNEFILYLYDSQITSIKDIKVAYEEFFIGIKPRRIWLISRFLNIKSKNNLVKVSKNSSFSKMKDKYFTKRRLMKISYFNFPFGT